MEYQLTELAALPRAVVIVEERYSEIFAMSYARPAAVADGLAELQISLPAGADRVLTHLPLFRRSTQQRFSSRLRPHPSPVVPTCARGRNRGPGSARPRLRPEIRMPGMTGIAVELQHRDHSGRCRIGECGIEGDQPAPHIGWPGQSSDGLQRGHESTQLRDRRPHRPPRARRRAKTRVLEGCLAPPVARHPSTPESACDCSKCEQNRSR
ncbi:putative eRCC4 domain-containing protein [Mycobacterium kansasii]|uniref:Putative eRCC4 domain-containing protein n=1 Tax=Mycobacterium kansasii TaxID=1768 RepID=A0A1V3WF04_MYCKA|nr:putative eRCC4 domain-containing protein [Mycobacterium kansasii]